MRALQMCEEQQCTSLILNPTLDGGVWSDSHLGCFTLAERTPYIY